MLDELPGVQRVGHEVGVVHLVGAEVDGGVEQGVHAGLRALGKGDQGEALEIDVGAGGEVFERGDDVLRAFLVGRAEVVVLGGVLVGHAALEVAWYAAGVVAGGEEGGVAEGDEEVASIAELGREGVGRGDGVGDGVVGPEAAGALQEADDRVGSGAVDGGSGR